MIYTAISLTFGSAWAKEYERHFLLTSPPSNMVENIRATLLVWDYIYEPFGSPVRPCHSIFRGYLYRDICKHLDKWITRTFHNFITILHVSRWGPFLRIFQVFTHQTRHKYHDPPFPAEENPGQALIALYRYNYSPRFALEF